MQIDPTFNPEGNELADQIIQDRALLKHTRLLFNKFDESHRYVVIKLAVDLRKKGGIARVARINPIEDTRFLESMAIAINLLASMKLETFLNIALEEIEQASVYIPELQQAINLLIRCCGVSIFQ